MEHSSNVDYDSCAWTNTRQSVAQFRELLLCSKCSKLMNEPVCLGACEHMFCRSCAGPYAGDGCCVCRSPAWVKDIQVNRQLNNITQLFCSLESLLNPKDLSETPPPDPSPMSTAVQKNKKNFKIWFSPRSRKVRCRVEKANEDRIQEEGPRQALLLPPAEDPPGSKDLSVFNFNSSSQDSSSSPQHDSNDCKTKKKQMPKKKRKCPSSGLKPATRKQTKLNSKREKLATINKEWGFAQDPGKGAQDEELEVGSEDRPNRKVSFQVPDVVPGSLMGPQLQSPVGDTPTEIPSVSAGEEGPATEGLPTMEEPVAPRRQNISPRRPRKPAASSSNPGESSPRQPLLSPACRPSKRTLPPEVSRPESTPKRPRRSVVMGPAWPTPPPSPASPGIGSPPRRRPNSQGVSCDSSRTPGWGSPGGSRGRLSQGSPAHLKRNHKGETPLHLAAIKGDLEAVKELLVQGADPNLKDYAGWTPLHEACNLGHLEVVEVLLQKGALLNTPGYQNDSPLHDAVRNGHKAVARLLLEHGASRDVLNMFGLRPVDCAVTAEMQALLQAPSEGPHPLNTPLSPTASLSKVPACVRRGGQVRFLGSKLTMTQQKQMTKLGRLLGARHVDSFSSSVTHIIVPESPMPTTQSCLRGVLHGCWILRFSWVEACLKEGSWADESEHEAGEGPQRSRLNRDNLFPQLFDGCFFFLLGSFKKPPKEDLLQLVKEGGGQVLARQPKPDSDVTQTLSAAAYHAQPGSDQALCTQYILYDPRGSYKPPRVRLGKVWSAPSSWLLDCISAFQLLPVPEL